MTLTTHNHLEQGSPEWLQLRCGMLTASQIGQLITPKTIKPANNDISRGLTTQLVAERITGRTEVVFETNDMLRGHLDEPIAKQHYSEHHNSTITDVGFIVLDMPDGQLGYSPDGLVGDDGLIEVKSRRPKKHIQTILADEVPLENLAQCMAGLFVSGRDWIDYVSWCGGLPMFVKRVTPDTRWFDTITEVIETFEQNATTMTSDYRTATHGLPQTQHIDHFADVELKL